MLRTEADVVRALDEGTYTLEELYALCERQADTGREGGEDPLDGHGYDRRWKRRLRGVLQNLKASGRAERLDRGVWALRGTRERPERLVLVVAGETSRQFELRLQAAIELLGDLDEPADLVLTDPPYALARGSSRARDGGYGRDSDKVVGGYVDIDPGAYEEFTFGWIEAAAAALRPAGQLAVVTGPQQAAIVQYAAQKTGLTWVSSIAARREFALRSTRRPACAHWTVTVMCNGGLRHPRRVFNTPADLPRARSGVEYPLDVWLDNGRADRPGLLRYDNSLPLRLVQRIVEAFSDPDELVVDPHLGGGTTAIACDRAGRRFVGGDLNPAAVRFSAARLLDEHIWPRHREPALFDLQAA
jgi:DNA methylase